MNDIMGTTAENPIRLWDRMDILNYLERRFGEEFFINGEQVVKTNECKEVKLIQLKLDSGEYKNFYLGLL
jgi:hypothetical protein